DALHQVAAAALAGDQDVVAVVSAVERRRAAVESQAALLLLGAVAFVAVLDEDRADPIGEVGRLGRLLSPEEGREQTPGGDRANRHPVTKQRRSGRGFGGKGNPPAPAGSVRGGRRVSGCSRIGGCILSSWHSC